MTLHDAWVSGKGHFLSFSGIWSVTINSHGDFCNELEISDLSRRPVFARMEANPVAIRIRNPCPPAYPCLDWLDENFDAVSAANVDCSPNVVDRERNARRPAPVPFGMAFMSRAVKTERQRFGGELTPEIVPLVPALEAKHLLIEGTSPTNVFGVIHHEIERPNRNCSPTR